MNIKPIVLALLALSLAGCSGVDLEQGSAGGGLGGALVGAMVGGPVGAVVGAGAGAAAGAGAVTAQQQAAKPEQTLKQPGS